MNSRSLPAAQGERREPAPDRALFHCRAYSHPHPHPLTPGLFRHTDSPNVHSFGMKEETRRLGENPRQSGENTQTAQTVTLVQIRHFLVSSTLLWNNVEQKVFSEDLLYTMLDHIQYKTFSFSTTALPICGGFTWSHSARTPFSSYLITWTLPPPTLDHPTANSLSTHPRTCVRFLLFWPSHHIVYCLFSYLYLTLHCRLVSRSHGLI